MKRILAYLFVLAVIVTFGSAPADAGQIYKYTDEYGNVHVVDDARKIPKQYRDETESRRARTPVSAPAGDEGGGSGDEPKEGDTYKGEAPADGADVDLTGLPPGIDPRSVVGKDPKTGKFLLDPTRPERLDREKKEKEELQKKQKLGQADKEGHDEAYWRKRIADCRSQLRKSEDAYKSAQQTFLNNPDYAQTPKDRATVDGLKKAYDNQKAQCDRIPSEARSAGAPPGWVL